MERARNLNAKQRVQYGLRSLHSRVAEQHNDGPRASSGNQGATPFSSSPTLLV